MTDPGPFSERFLALGAMVEAAAFAEVSGRMAFCALEGSKYAAVVGGGIETGGLIGYCKAITEQHHELTRSQREAILAELAACAGANSDRNRMTHDLIVGRPSGASATIQSQRKSYQLAVHPRPVGHIKSVAAALIKAQHQLLAALEDALGVDSLGVALSRLGAARAEREPT